MTHLSSNAPPDIENEASEYQILLIQHLWKVHQQEFQKYYDKPNTHPKYYGEWAQFVHKRSQRIVELGEDPSSYDFEPEWKVYWEERLQKIYLEDWKEKKKQHLPNSSKVEDDSNSSSDNRHSRSRSRSLPRSRLRPRSRSRSPIRRKETRIRSRLPNDSKLKSNKSNSRSRSDSSSPRPRSKTKRKYKDRSGKKSKKRRKHHDRASKISDNKKYLTSSKGKPCYESDSSEDSSDISLDLSSSKKSQTKEKYKESSDSTGKLLNMKKIFKMQSTENDNETDENINLKLVRQHLLKELNKLNMEFVCDGIYGILEERGSELENTRLDSLKSAGSKHREDTKETNVESKEKKDKVIICAESEKILHANVFQVANLSEVKKVKENEENRSKADKREQGHDEKFASIYDLEEEDDLPPLIELLPGTLSSRGLDKDNNGKSPISNLKTQDVQSIYELEDKCKRMCTSIELNFEKTKMELNFSKRHVKEGPSFPQFDAQSLTNKYRNVVQNPVNECQKGDITDVNKVPYIKDKSTENDTDHGKILNTLRFICNLKDLHGQLISEVQKVYDNAVNLKAKGFDPAKCLENEETVITLRRVCTALNACMVSGNLREIQKIFRGELLKLIEDILESHLVASNKLLHNVDIKAIAKCTLGSSKEDIVKFIHCILVCNGNQKPTVENVANILAVVLEEQSRHHK